MDSRFPIAIGTASISLFFASTATYAADADSQIWTQFNLNKRYSNGVRLFAEIQPRFGDNNERLTQLIVRPAIGYTLNKRMSVWLGYGWTPSTFPEYTNENRIFQQFLVEDSFPSFSMSNRTRLEERFIEGAGASSVRIRHLLRISKPLDSKNQWALVGSNELFWNLNTTPRGPQSGFDQNRIFLGLSKSVAPQTRIEFGYLGSFINPPNHRPDRRFDVLMVAVNYNL